MASFIFVALGGALGTMARYGINLLLHNMSGFFVATFSVNVIGSLLLGGVVGWLSRQPYMAEIVAHNVRLFLVVGVFGGFTTFSTFSWEVFQLFERREIFYAVAYISGSVIFSVLGFMAGYALMRSVLS
ncbi:MAG: fluoride efflux transporter CrcB [Parvibaculales bacterium]